jgi:hypothetical protein
MAGPAGRDDTIVRNAASIHADEGPSGAGGGVMMPAEQTRRIAAITGRVR